MHRFRLILLLAAVLCAFLIHPLHAALFRVTNLGTLGGNYSIGTSVNNLGHVVGSTEIHVPDKYAAFFYDGTNMHFLGGSINLASNKGAARINSNDEVIGGQVGRSSYIFKGGQFLDFGAINLELTDINDASIYVGEYSGLPLIGDSSGTEYILPESGQPTFTNGSAAGINNSGKVVGEYLNGPSFARSAFYYDDGSGQVTLVPPPTNYNTIHPRAINESGAFTGIANGAQTRSFICSGVGQAITIIPLASGFTYSNPHDISDTGMVVGYGGTGSGLTSAYLYHDGQTHRLSEVVNGTALGWVFEDAYGISPNGKYITGLGRFNGQQRAFLLTEIEPEKYILITRASRSGNTFTLTFASDPGLTGWLIKASTNMQSFPIDETADSTVTEGFPGVYQAVVDVTGAPSVYFLRVERL
jgi:probable HAF family extracellular repeat protein